MHSRTSQTLLQKSASSAKFLVDTAAQRNTSNDRVIKRRASRACRCCRERKVRCNIVEYGPPCTNCRLDNVICIAAENKRKTKHIFSYTKLQHQTLERPGSHKPHFRIPEFEISLNSTASPMDDLDLDLENMSDAGSFMNGGNFYETALCDFQETFYQTHIERSNGSDYSPILDFDKSSPSLSLDLLDPSHLLGSSMPIIQDIVFEPPLSPAREALPSYLMEIPSHLTTDETDILLRKSALSIPEHAIRSRLLQAYIEYVHPCMPLINVHELLHTIQANGKSGRISLMLFQAIMFAGTTFIDMDHLHAVGFANRREAQYTFYQKCRILYDVDYETDYIALIQSLLLMANSNSHYSPDDPKCSQHWLEIAISLSYRIGLHSNLGKFKLDVKKQRLLKRVWWSCLMQDRLVALETKGLVGIKDGDFDIPMLTLEDFEIEALPRDNCIISPEFSLIRDKWQQTELALICIETAKLCLCIGHIVSLQYSVLCRDYNNNNHKYRLDSDITDLQDTIVPSIPQTRHLKHLNRVRDCDSELSAWAENLPSRFRLTETSSPSQWLDQYSIEYQQRLAPKTKTLLLSHSLLHILHSAAVTALHEPQQSLSPSSTSISTDADTISNEYELHELSLLRVHTACRTIASLTLQLHTLHLHTYLPTTAIAMLVPALIRHLSNLYTSAPIRPDNDYSPYDDIYSRDDSSGDYHEISNTHDGEEDTGFIKRQRWKQCVKLLESLQTAFPNIAACHTISVLGVAAATSRFQRADFEPGRAVTMRNARREEVLRAPSAALIEEGTGSCCSGCESETSCGSVDGVSDRSGIVEIVGSSGSIDGSTGSHSTRLIDEMDVGAFPPSLSIIASGGYDHADAINIDLHEKYLIC